jgi:hypothetical protein
VVQEVLLLEQAHQEVQMAQFHLLLELDLIFLPLVVVLVVQMQNKLACLVVLVVAPAEVRP